MIVDIKAILAEVRGGMMNTPAIRAVRKRVTKQIAGEDRADVLRFTHDLIRRASFGRFMGCELMHYHAATMESITVAEVEALGEGISNWAEVDTFSIYVSGPAWLGGRIPDVAIVRWAKSEDRWWRRAALVSTVPLHDPQRTFRNCKMLLHDRDDMVVKAMSWALRALVVREPESVREFLSDHRQQLAPRVIREVENKLATGVKNPKKQGMRI